MATRANATATVPATCSRCNGTGGWEGWPGFTCYRCHGTGKDPVARVPKGIAVRRPAPRVSKEDQWRNAGRDAALANEPCLWSAKCPADYAHYYRMGWAVAVRDAGQPVEVAVEWSYARGAKRRPDGTIAEGA